jgi:alcohol dehydrogenase class IV
VKKGGIKTMRSLNFAPAEIITGKGSLSVLKTLPGDRFMVVTGGSMRRNGTLGRISTYLDGKAVLLHEGIGKNPTIHEVEQGLSAMKAFVPDTVIALGGGSAIDAAKAMILFYENPDLQFDHLPVGKLPDRRKHVRLIAIPSTSGTASEVTKTSVITDPERGLKIPINCMANKPDIAILDCELTMSLPDNIVAETGMDALTHAVEAYLRTDCDDFDAVLAVGAILGILDWLPVSYTEKTEEAREKMHNFQCLAGLAFTNAGLTMVHGIAHALGGYYNFSHGLINAILLPYVLSYNRQDPSVARKLERLARLSCCSDFVCAVEQLNDHLHIPRTIREMGLDEKTYQKDRRILAENSLMGPTASNPIKMNPDSIAAVIDSAYYGR